MWRHASLVALISVLTGDVFASTIYVDQHNPNCPGSGTATDPFCRIQDAIVAASDGDRIEVAPGNYLELIDFLGKAIEVMSRDGADVTKIRAPSWDPTVVLWSGESNASVFRGFTVDVGLAGVFVAQGSNPIIRDNIFLNGIHSIDVRTGAHPTIDGNTFVGGSDMVVRGPGSQPTIIANNVFDSSIIGLTLGGSAIIERNILKGGTSYLRGGISVRDGSVAVVSENSFEGCSDPDGDGAAVFVQDSVLEATNNVFADNSAKRGGAVSVPYGGKVHLKDSVFVGNSAATGSAVYGRCLRS